MTVRDLAELTRGLSAEAFAARCPHPFLLRIDAPEGRDGRLSFSTVTDSDRDFTRKTNIADMEVLPIAPQFPDSNPKKIRLGRLGTNDITIKHAKVSANHAFFVARDGSWFLQDNQSSNGTLMNGEMLTPQELYPVRPGSQIELGRAIGLFFCENDYLYKLTVSLRA